MAPGRDRHPRAATLPLRLGTEGEAEAGACGGDSAVCQDSLQDSGPLTWCRQGCGNNIHCACLAMWAAHKTVSQAAVTCPMCRATWKDEDLKVVAEKQEEKVRCGGCHQRLRGARYRCLMCQVRGAADATGFFASPDLYLTRGGPGGWLVRFGLVCMQKLNLCNVCFAGRAHAHHPFVMRHAPKEPWQPAPRGSFGVHRLSSDLVRTLQQRELTDEDLGVLQGLDAHMELPAYLCVRPTRRG